MANPQYFELPAILDSQASSQLHDSLSALRGDDVELGASAVRRLGGQCLQILLAARAAWGSDGHGLIIRDISADFVSALALFGVSPDLSVIAEEGLS